MSELIIEYFTCKICHQNTPISHEEIDDMPTTCNDCWLKMEIWEKYEDPDLKKNF
ncbi:hypothetical protein [Nitrosopumilus sp.]|uniref:hypothetical protein n=1 Tax=Nitrosopumilus sp. TaxID=2024843 RepID=UPI00247C7E4B|nr:hypothetical protein [Nitrosopumilus sp.]MCV0430515.1 hypothetical protein [Nitrosopumilus sp.]